MARLATRPAALAVLVALALALPASAANIVLVNLDPPGFGLNDPTPAAPVGGNPGVTLGEQRTNVYLFAADLWGNVLESDVPILVGATFQPLACTPTSGTLGAAGATFVNANFPNAALANTWYHTALADAIAGQDLVPNNLDIISFFNSDIDTNPNCLTGASWYYGFDNDEGPSGIDFLNVVVHEIAHGLGFSNFTNETNGQLLAGLPGVYDYFTKDVTTGKTWEAMTDAERQASAINSLNVVWDGPAVNLVKPFVLGPRPSVRMLNPLGLGSIEGQPASFGPPLELFSGATGRIVVADDATGTPSDACEPLTNNAHGKIVLADRGSCTFTTKALNAQAAGAKGLIVANNQPKGLSPMGGSDPAVTIPSIGITRADGAAIKAVHNPVGRLILDPLHLAGTASNGEVRLYAPDPVASGSSISHFDTTASPNLIMEPFINSDLEAAHDLDLTPFLLFDVGWTIDLSGLP